MCQSIFLTCKQKIDVTKQKYYKIKSYLINRCLSLQNSEFTNDIITINIYIYICIYLNVMDHIKLSSFLGSSVLVAYKIIINLYYLEI